MIELYEKVIIKASKKNGILVDRIYGDSTKECAVELVDSNGNSYDLVYCNENDIEREK